MREEKSDLYSLNLMLATLPQEDVSQEDYLLSQARDAKSDLPTVIKVANESTGEISYHLYALSNKGQESITPIEAKNEDQAALDTLDFQQPHITVSPHTAIQIIPSEELSDAHQANVIAGQSLLVIRRHQGQDGSVSYYLGYCHANNLYAERKINDPNIIEQLNFAPHGNVENPVIIQSMLQLAEQQQSKKLTEDNGQKVYRMLVATQPHAFFPMLLKQHTDILLQVLNNHQNYNLDQNTAIITALCNFGSALQTYFATRKCSTSVEIQNFAQAIVPHHSLHRLISPFETHQAILKTVMQIASTPIPSDGATNIHPYGHITKQRNSELLATQAQVACSLLESLLNFQEPEDTQRLHAWQLTLMEEEIIQAIISSPANIHTHTQTLSPKSKKSTLKQALIDIQDTLLAALNHGNQRRIIVAFLTLSTGLMFKKKSSDIEDLTDDAEIKLFILALSPYKKTLQNLRSALEQPTSASLQKVEGIPRKHFDHFITTVELVIKLIDTPIVSPRLTATIKSTLTPVGSPSVGMLPPHMLLPEPATNTPIQKDKTIKKWRLYAMTVAKFFYGLCFPFGTLQGQLHLPAPSNKALQILCFPFQVIFAPNKLNAHYHWRNTILSLHIILWVILACCLPLLLEQLGVSISSDFISSSFLSFIPTIDFLGLSQLQIFCGMVAFLYKPLEYFIYSKLYPTDAYVPAPIALPSVTQHQNPLGSIYHAPGAHQPTPTVVLARNPTSGRPCVFNETTPALLQGALTREAAWISPSSQQSF